MTIQARRVFAAVFNQTKAIVDYIFLYYYHTVLQYYKSLTLFQKFFNQNS